MTKKMSTDIRHKVCVYRINVILSMIHGLGSIREVKDVD